MDKQTPLTETKTKQVQTDQIKMVLLICLSDKLNGVTDHNNVRKSKQQLKEEEEVQHTNEDKLGKKGDYNKRELNEDLPFASVDLGTKGERKNEGRERNRRVKICQEKKRCTKWVM